MPNTTNRYTELQTLLTQLNLTAMAEGFRRCRIACCQRRLVS